MNPNQGFHSVQDSAQFPRAETPLPFPQTYRESQAMAGVAGWGCPCRKSKGGITEAVSQAGVRPSHSLDVDLVLLSLSQQKSLELA